MFPRFAQMYCLRVKRLKSISSRFISFEPITDVAPLTVHYGCANDYMCIAYDTNTLSIQFYSAHTTFCGQTVKTLTGPCLYSILLYKFAGYKSRTIF
jgi:hypothetical protein